MTGVWGIGADIARVSHGAGATVALSGTRVKTAEALAELGARTHVLPCNLSADGGRRGAETGG